MSVNRTSLGKRISFYRSKSTLTQEALAAKVNCSREYIVQIENGTKVPSLSVLVEIANTLSVSADELLINCHDGSIAACKITIKGGTFVGFNPAASTGDTIDGKPANWVAEGYESVETENPGTWIVRKKN